MSTAGSDLLGEIHRRSSGHPIHSILAYPVASGEWQVMVKMKEDPAVA